MFESIKAQFRVIAALTLRDMQNQNSKLEGGFAWAIVDVLIYVGVMSLIRVVVKAFMPPGIPPFTFLVLGILPWQAFDHTAKTVEQIVQRNAKLLVLPVVTPLDIILAAALDKLCIYATIFVALVSITAHLEGVGPPHFPLGIILLFLSSWLMGLSFGLCQAPLYRMFPPIKWLIKPLKRVMLWTSGLYFVVSTLPSTTWPYLTWNPLLHVNELMRQYWFTTYISPVASPPYLVMWIVGLAVLGLSMERFIRRVPV